MLNFHQYGNEFLIPYHGVVPNTMAQEHPDISQIFNEIVDESQFPEGTNIGPSTEAMGGVSVGGIASDWIVHDLGIPSAEYELGKIE